MREAAVLTRLVKVLSWLCQQVAQDDQRPTHAWNTDSFRNSRGRGAIDEESKQEEEGGWGKKLER